MSSQPTMVRSAPYDLFPLEISQHIFRDFSGATLLRTATICRDFSLLCVPSFLERICPRGKILADDMYLNVDTLRAYYLLFRPLPVKRLVCELQLDSLHRDLTYLRGVVLRSPQLATVSIDFGGDLFSILDDQDAPVLILAAFYSILEAAMRNLSGPVVILGCEIFACRPRDITSWDLRDQAFQFGSASLLHRWASRLHRALKGRHWTSARFYNGRVGPVRALSSLHSVLVRRLTSATPRRSLALLTLDPATITTLSLRTDRPGALDLSYFNAILTEVFLPSLWNLAIHTDALDSVSLRSFLERHPGVQRVEYYGTNTEGTTRPIFEPPLAHPGLATLQTFVASGRRSNGRLLRSLDASPNLHTFYFHLSVSLLVENVAGLLADLRRIAARTQETTLRFSIEEERVPVPWSAGAGAEFWPKQPDAHAVASILHCVCTLNIVTWSVPIARRLLPWIALLPALEAVHFTLHLKYTSPHQRRVHGFGRGLSVNEPIQCDFLAEAREALKVKVNKITATAC